MIRKQEDMIRKWSDKGIRRTKITEKVQKEKEDKKDKDEMVMINYK